MPPGHYAVLCSSFLEPWTMDVSAARRRSRTDRGGRPARQALPRAYLDRGVPAAPAVRDPAGQPRIRRPTRRPLPRCAEGISRSPRRGSPRSARRSTVEKLSRNGQIDHEIWTHALEYSLWSVENDNRFEFDPRVYGEYISDSVFLLFTQSTLPRERNVAERRQADRRHPEGRRRGEGGPEEPAEGAHRDRHQAQPRRDRLLREGDLRRSPRRRPAASRSRTPCQQAVKALKDYQTWLEKELLPKSTGEWRLGKEKFAKKLELELDAGPDARMKS